MDSPANKEKYRIDKHWTLVAVEKLCDNEHCCVSSVVFGYACDQAWQMESISQWASNVWALLTKCTYVYSWYEWLDFTIEE